MARGFPPRIDAPRSGGMSNRVSDPRSSRVRVVSGVVALMLAGFAMGQFAAGFSVLNRVFSFSLMQDSGSSVAQRVSALRGLVPNRS